MYCVSKDGHPFCFCYNVVSHGLILVIFWQFDSQGNL